MSRFVLIRSNISGVWAGELVASTDNSRTMQNARRVWNWRGRLSCSELANHGPGENSRVCAPVSRIEIDRAPGDEMIDMAPGAADAFEKAPEAST